MHLSDLNVVTLYPFEIFYIVGGLAESFFLSLAVILLNNRIIIDHTTNQ